MKSRLNKRLPGVIIILGLLLSVHVARAHSSQPTVRRTPTSPEKVVKQFYSWYLNASYPEPDKQHRAKFRRFVTQRCLQKHIAADDYVYFIQGQDAEPEWKNNISVSAADIRGSKATTTVALTSNGYSYKLKIYLVRENGEWRIDDVKGQDRVEG